MHQPIFWRSRFEEGGRVLVSLIFCSLVSSPSTHYTDCKPPLCRDLVQILQRFWLWFSFVEGIQLLVFHAACWLCSSVEKSLFCFLPWRWKIILKVQKKRMMKTSTFVICFDLPWKIPIRPQSDCHLQTGARLMEEIFQLAPDLSFVLSARFNNCSSSGACIKLNMTSPNHGDVLSCARVTLSNRISPQSVYATAPLPAGFTDNKIMYTVSWLLLF